MFKIGYDKRSIEFFINEKNFLGEILPNRMETGLTGEAEVKRAIENPIGTERLKDIVRPNESVAIITSDITRPMPSKYVLPFVIEELTLGGVEEKDITIVLALGSHRKHTEEEVRYLVGEEVYSRIKCVDSDTDNCKHLGTCNNGTPVDVFRTVAEADRRICLGNIEYHYFAGYSGGAKAIMPGVSTREAIQANHSNMVDPRAKTGSIEDNPVRQDIDQVGEFITIDFILNVVLDSKKNIIRAVAGHYIKAHREGCAFLDNAYKARIQQKADIVVVTPGGYPKDINLYQAQKALDNAKHAVKDGGIVILAASCKEGLGEEVFEQWLLEAKKPEDLIERIKRKFKLGGHKAAAIAMVMQSAKVYLVSDLEADFVRKLFMVPFNDIQEAVDAALREQGEEAKILLMPSGSSTLPVME
ncbi:MAG: nickel-dependent malate racemase, LarAH6 family [Clostridia bacterium]